MTISSCTLPSNKPDNEEGEHETTTTTQQHCVLAEYLERIEAQYQNREWPRVYCSECGASRHIYCFDCFKLLIPPEDWPESIRDHTLKLLLPFQLDILLDDRPSSSTGVQLATLFQQATATNDDVQDNSVCRLFDQERGQDVPKYNKQHEDGREGESDDAVQSVLLYPGPGSKPLSSLRGVDPKNLRLVVLDCRWKRSTRLLDCLRDLPMVHLDNPPSASYYWRWHNAGPGCLSTAEAVFWAARELKRVNSDDHDDDDERLLLDILWLFATQRSVIMRRFHAEVEERTIPHLPFSDQAKEQARELRRKQKLASAKALEDV